MVLWYDENEFLSCTLQEDASATILHKASQTRWRMGSVALQEDGPIDVGHVWLRSQRSICEEYAGRFRGEVAHDRLRFHLFGREGREVGYFSCQFRLVGSALEVHLLDIDEALPSLVFPPPLESESLVLPMGVGRWIRQPLAERAFWVYPAHLNMRWFGGLQGDAGWLAILDEGYADAGALATGLSISPGWLKSLGTWQGSRTVRYAFTTGGYVGLAKTFRGYAQEKGLHHALQEKLERTPALRNLHGGRLLSFMQAHSIYPERFEDRLEPVQELPASNPRVLVSHAEVKKILDEVQATGLERSLVVLRGWIHGGYDESHPDIWPPDPALGTLEELAELVRRNTSLTVALHDNYQDIYQQSASWPQGTIRLPSGDPLPGGLWAGGQAYILNARAGLAYAWRNWPQIRTLQPRAMFIDTTTAVQFYQSYEPGNQLSRSEDETYKLALLRFYKEQGVALGSEEAADFGMPWVDWLENRHRRVAGVSIPLWPLVFHDAAFCVRYTDDPTEPETSESPAPRWLTDMLWGYALLWNLSTRAWATKKQDMLQLQFVDEWHRRVGNAEMLSHRYHCEDDQVEETVFSTGDTLLANFASEPRTIDGVYIPGRGYALLRS